MQLLSSRIILQPPKCPPFPSLKTNNSFSQNPSSSSSSYSSFSSSHTLSANPPPNRKKFILKCRGSEYFEKQRFTKPSEETFTPQSLGALPPRVFVGHSIYKGKAALTVEPKSPEFVPLDSGAFKLSKEGFVLLQFAPAVGVRQYDWNRKQVFSLSVTEIGTLMGLGPRDSCEFFHDPFKGKSEEGKVRKVLKAEPLPDGSGHFFNLNVQNKLLNVDENIYIPITKAELTVLISAFNFIMPYLLGWHTFVNSIKPSDTSRVNNTNTNSRSGADLEWSR
ncbi:Plant transcription factor [Macleaya cordata]|uniref:Plant transcription factor n=1 Tax=Macleaya cordata TaxID=56857 RepID=A0A200QS92_MACCD|nr:Plant transcription factor [Macleaya cordata]